MVCTSFEFYFIFHFQNGIEIYGINYCSSQLGLHILHGSSLENSLGSLCPQGESERAPLFQTVLHFQLYRHSIYKQHSCVTRGRGGQQLRLFCDPVLNSNSCFFSSIDLGFFSAIDVSSIELDFDP